VKSWLLQTADVWRLLKQLRPYLGEGRGLLLATLVSSFVMVVFEGVGVGLLVPLLSLLLGGTNAVPMRPIQWLQGWFPNHSPAFYVGVCCVAIVAAITAKNVAGYVAALFSARLRRRVATSLREALFASLQRASLDMFDQRPGGEFANVFLVETYRTTVAIEAAVGFAQRGGIALFYVGALFYISWPLTWLVVALGLSIGSTIAFIYRRLGRAGTRLTDLNHRLSSVLEQSFAGVRVVRATNAQEAEIARFREVNAAQAASEEETVRTHFLLFPIVETLGVVGAMVIVACAYIFFVRPGHMLSSYLLGYGFVLLRLLPLLNTLYSAQGNLFYVAGGIREVQRFLDTPIYPVRPFGARTSPGSRRRCASNNSATPTAPARWRCATWTSKCARARRWRSWAVRVRASRRSPRCCCGCGRRPRDGSWSMTSTTGSSPPRAGTGRSRWSNRTRSSFTARCARTCSTAGSTCPRGRSSGRSRRPASPT
jgi:ABC-type multidrug transport system fused ATPase/permease subunit